MSAHGFSMYQIAGIYAGSRVIKVPERNLTADIDAMLAAVSPSTRLMFLANPNNPTGSMLAAETVTRLRGALPPEVLLVIDSAYAEYVTRSDYDAGATLVDTSGNTVMTRTFSKIMVSAVCGSDGAMHRPRWWMCSTVCANRSTFRSLPRPPP